MNSKFIKQAIKNKKITRKYIKQNLINVDNEQQEQGDNQQIDMQQNLDEMLRKLEIELLLSQGNNDQIRIIIQNLEELEEAHNYENYEKKYDLIKAQALVKLNRFEDALMIYDNAIQRSPNDPILYQEKGFEIKIQVLANTLKLLQLPKQALEYDKKQSFQILKMLDIIQEKVKIFQRFEFRIEEALTCFETAIEKDPKESKYYYGKARALKLLNRFDDYLKSLDQAIQINPKSSELYAQKADTLRRKNNLKEALVQYNKEIELNHSDSQLYADKAQILQLLNRYIEALDEWQQAIKINPDIPNYYYGQAYALSNNFKQ